MVGVPDPTDVSALAGASADASKSTEMSVGQGAAGFLGYMGENRGLAGIGLQQNAEQERQRFNAQQQELTAGRNALQGERAGIQAKNMQDLRDFELSKAQFGETKASNLFQQYLAQKELDLKTKDQTFQQWLAGEELGIKQGDQDIARDTLGLEREKFLQSSKIDWANVSIEQDKTKAMFAQIEADMANAKTAAEAEKAKLRGEGLAKGLEWLSGYLTPGKGQASSQSSKYPYGKGNAGADETVGTADDVADFQKLYADAYNGLLNYTGKSDALRILMRSPYSDWRKKAKAEYNKLKRRPGNNPSTGGNLTKYPQGTPQKGDPGYKKPKKKKYVPQKGA